MNIKNVNVVFEFEPDNDIVLSTGQNVKCLQEALNARSQLLNVPPTMPREAPRLIITFNNVLVKISLNRFEYTIEVPTHVQQDINEAFNYISAVVENVNKFLNADERGYKWSGAVATIEYPCDRTKVENSIKAITPVFDKIINIDRAGRDLASFNLQYGFREGNYYKSFTITGYDTYQIEIPSPDKANIETPLIIELTKDASISETGIGVQVDFNNKPMDSHKASMEEMADIINAMKETTADLVNITNLGGVLCG